MHSRRPLRVNSCRAALAVAALGAAAAGCTPVESVGPDWPPQALQWYERANASYRSLDLEDADEAVLKALQMQPDRPEVRLLAGRIALSKLDYAGAIKAVEGLTDSDARAMRGRALWYSGAIDQAADELEALLADPEVRDQWAAGVIKLARTGRGRQPFSISGPMLAVLEMPRLEGTSMVVPVELNGQPVLGLISTGSTEVIVDSSTGREPSWVSLRFQQRIEVKDVPALTQDLSGISRELNAPIKVMLGSNLLRHLNVTFDYLGRQFVVRNYEPPPPPRATELPIQYIRGGGMVLRSQIGHDAEAPRFALFVDTGSNYPLVLDETAWERTKLSTLRKPVGNQAAGVTQALLPQVRLGAYGLSDVTAVGGVPFDDLEQVLGIELDGLLGSGVLSSFRVTLANHGRTMWLEEMPNVLPDAAPEQAPVPELELTPPAAPAIPG